MIEIPTAWAGRYSTPAAQPAGRRLISFWIPRDLDFKVALNELISRLGAEDIWKDRDGIDAVDAAQLGMQVYLSYLKGEMIGTIFAYTTTDVPPGCLPCDGAEYSATDYPLLYDRIDSAFKGIGVFTVPDLRGRFIFGENQDDMFGVSAGARSHTLTTDEMPSHTHTNAPHNHAYDPVVVGDLDLEGAGVPQPNAAQIIPLVTENTYEASITIDSAGGSQAHNNMPPYLALRYCIVAG